MHGGKSSGPLTTEGRQRSAKAKTVHGNETTAKRLERSEASARLAVLEMTGYALGFMEGSRTRGPKPKHMDKVEVALQLIVGKLMRRGFCNA